MGRGDLFSHDGSRRPCTRLVVAQASVSSRCTSRSGRLLSTTSWKDHRDQTSIHTLAISPITTKVEASMRVLDWVWLPLVLALVAKVPAPVRENGLAAGLICHKSAARLRVSGTRWRPRHNRPRPILSPRLYRHPDYPKAHFEPLKAKAAPTSFRSALTKAKPSRDHTSDLVPVKKATSYTHRPPQATVSSLRREISPPEHLARNTPKFRSTPSERTATPQRPRQIMISNAWPIKPMIEL